MTPLTPRPPTPIKLSDIGPIPGPPGGDLPPHNHLYMTDAATQTYDHGDHGKSMTDAATQTCDDHGDHDHGKQCDDKYDDPKILFKWIRLLMLARSLAAAAASRAKNGPCLIP